MKSKLLTGLLGFFIAILIITFSIGLPIYVRPFYYLQIDLLDIPEDSGASREDVITAFNEVMDYLTLPGEEFSTGIFRHSESGKSHFVDCKRLFDLNICAFFISLIGAATLLMLNKRKFFELWRPFGMNVSFCSGAYTLGIGCVVGGLVERRMRRKKES